MGYYQGELELYAALDNLPSMPKQREFCYSEAAQAAYVGGQGSAKSTGLCLTAIIRALAEPHGFSLIGRLNMPALESTTMKTFLEMVPEDMGSWAEAKKLWKFKNGHEVIFKHLDISDPKVTGHIRSLNLSAVYVDEATEIAEEVYFLLLGRLRRQTTIQIGLSHILRLASNPAGHDWIWKRFFDPQRKEEWKSNHGINASSMENPFLPEDYVRNMLHTYPADWAERFIYGSFSDFSDAVFKEFAEDTHSWDPMKPHAVFQGSNNPPDYWPVIIGIDIGSDTEHDPWACVLISVAPDGRLYQFAEVYGSNLLIARIAGELKMKLGQRRIEGTAYDYAQRQCALELAEYGVVGTAAIKEVQPGLFKCAQYIHLDDRIDHPFNPKAPGSPRFFVSASCVNTLREFGGYKWAKDKAGRPNGEPDHACSHSPSAVRYALHTFRPLPDKLKEPKKWENDKLNLTSREYWRAAEQFPDRMERFLPRDRTLKSMAEWRQELNKPPLRFQRPRIARYSRI
jgi:phage terminase large subunit